MCQDVSFNYRGHVGAHPCVRPIEMQYRFGW